MKRYLLAACAALTLSACGLEHNELTQKYARYADRAGFKPLLLQAGPFYLQAYERIKDPTPATPIRVFIEGDGKAWLTRNEASPDPTPYTPTGLFLASADNSANVAYLARPCQFFMTPNCTVSMWTSEQYNEENISALNKALDHWKGHPIELVGYSGGANVALLLAARRSDVINIRTVAGNTDNKAFTAYHEVSAPPPDSLDAADVITKTALIPQIHFVGEEDRIVPEKLAQAYQAKLPPGNCSKVITILNTDHMNGWPEHWPAMNQRLLPCTTPKSYYDQKIAEKL